MTNWLFGIPYEAAFWEAVYANPKERDKLFNFSHLGCPISLDGFDAAAFLLSRPQPEQALVLDVGCGMTFYPGDHILNGNKKIPINIHYIDPLARYYNKIAEQNHVNVPKVEFGMLEYLSSFYPDHNVTLIIINNALDHSANPLKGIIEAIHSLKTGGILYLNHHPNEAEAENYRGFHQYNITIEEEALIIWNKQQRLDINRLLAGFAQVTTLYAGQNPVAIIEKTQAVPEHLLDHPADIKTLCEALLDFSYQLTNEKKWHYPLKTTFYRIVQRLSKLLPFRLRQKIKSILK